MILSGQFDLAKSFLEREPTAYKCVYRMTIELLDERQIRAGCDGSYSDGDVWNRFVHDLITTGKADIEYEAFYEETKIRDMAGMGSFYQALHRFNKGDFDEGCQDAADMMSMEGRATA